MTRPQNLPVLPRPARATFHGGTVRRTDLVSLRVRGDVSPSLDAHIRRFARQNKLTRGRSGGGAHGVTLTIESPSDLPPEGYRLHLCEGISLSAGDEPGLFYGLQTLQQLLDASGPLRRCTIADRPALAVRGFYFDLTRQVPTVDFLKRIVDRLAAVKINTLMIQYREFFPYEGFPLIVSEQAYTPREVAGFVRYARDRCVRIVPLLQSLAFQEHILRAEAYAHLRERPRDISALCPTHPQSFRLYKALARQLIDAHPQSHFFHLGGDEATTVGHCPRCKQAQAGAGKATLVSGFTNKIIRFLTKRDLRPLMWADMLFGHLEDPEIASAARTDAPLERISYSSDMFAELSRDVIAADWDYWSTGPRTPAAKRSPYKGIAGFGHVGRLVDAGFQVIGFPSSSHAFNTERNGIDHQLAFANITAFARELRRRKCLGMVNTFWPTDALGQAWWHDLQSVSHPNADETIDVSYSQIRPGLEAHWYTTWRAAECAWSSSPHGKEDYDRVFSRVFLGTNDTSYPRALALASLPIESPSSPLRKRVPPQARKVRLEKAITLMRKAGRSARRGKPTVDYSNLFIRIQHHEILWRDFLAPIPPLAAPRLAAVPLRKLRRLTAERESLEKEFSRSYLALYKDVHLEEEIQLRFAEERRLQHQLLWAQERCQGRARPNSFPAAGERERK